MAKERFEYRTLDGKIKVTCKFDNNGQITVRLWECEKRDIVNKIIYIVDLYYKAGIYFKFKTTSLSICNQELDCKP